MNEDDREDMSLEPMINWYRERVLPATAYKRMVAGEDGVWRECPSTFPVSQADVINREPEPRE